VLSGALDWFGAFAAQPGASGGGLRPFWIRCLPSALDAQEWTGVNAASGAARARSRRAYHVRGWHAVAGSEGWAGLRPSGC
jgi:hypothetical protein